MEVWNGVVAVAATLKGAHVVHCSARMGERLPWVAAFHCDDDTAHR